ncbi:Uncharacterised protein [uncultured archaeon]|nr:Uncharacterised protein [uncultured archaeon]
MNKKFIIMLGIAAIALVGGLFASQVSAYSGFENMMSGVTGGMMGGSFNAGSMHNMMNSAFGGMMYNMAGFSGMMNGLMHGNSSDIDMNQMHRAMHGENSRVDMNGMHARMLAGNLTQEDYNEMKGHCPMMG